MNNTFLTENGFMARAGSASVKLPERTQIFIQMVLLRVLSSKVKRCPQHLIKTIVVLSERNKQFPSTTQVSTLAGKVRPASNASYASRFLGGVGTNPQCHIKTGSYSATLG